MIKKLLALAAIAGIGYVAYRQVAASRAEDDGADVEYVVAALIHDIGDNLAPFNHPEIAAGILKPVVSEKNWWMTKNHGIFQGYYFWHYIGLDRNTRDQFIGHEIGRAHV